MQQRMKMIMSILFRRAQCAFPMLLRLVGNLILHCSIDYGAICLTNDSAAMICNVEGGCGWWRIDPLLIPDTIISWGCVLDLHGILASRRNGTYFT